MTKPFTLIIEDSPVFSQMFSRALKDEFEVEVIQDGRDALTRLSVVTPDLMVLDLHLPGVSGKDILDRVKSDERFVKTRIILTTSDERQAEELRDLVDIVLLKPIYPGQLRELASRIKGD
ncbi:MAG: response regulator [Anaerolineales bacterium]|nr:response regulator [Anaerolineales bacterium]